MVDQDEINRVTRYIRGFITGKREDFDVIDTRALDALRRRSLADVLAEYQEAGLRIRPARGNTPRDAMELMEFIREKRGFSKKEVSERSGISRGHVHALLSNAAQNPTVESLIRLSIALEWPIELVELPAPERERASPSAHRKEPSLWLRAGVAAGQTLLCVGVVAGIFKIFESIVTGSKKGKK